MAQHGALLTMPGFTDYLNQRRRPPQPDNVTVEQVGPPAPRVMLPQYMFTPGIAPRQPEIRPEAPYPQPPGMQQPGMQQQAMQPGPPVATAGVQQMLDQVQRPTAPQLTVNPMQYLEQYGAAKDRITRALGEQASLADIAQALNTTAGYGGGFGNALNAIKAQKIKEQTDIYNMERDYAKTALEAYGAMRRPNDPALVATYKFREGLSPADREKLDALNRAPVTIDLGGGKLLIPSGGGPGTMLPKTPPPQSMPAFQEEVAKAKTTGAETGKRTFNMQGINEIINRAEIVLSGRQPPTGSYMGWAVDQAGQIVGYSPAGANEATELEAIGGALVAKMPRMEGPQSDYDRQMYIQMAGRIGDRTLPVDQRLTALRAVRGLWGKYESLNTGTAGAASPTGVWTIEEIK